MGVKYRVIHARNGYSWEKYLAQKLSWFGAKWLTLAKFQTQSEAELYCEQHAKGAVVRLGAVVSEFEARP